MRKQILKDASTRHEPSADSAWLDLNTLATVELTSEAPDHPFESALEQGAHGWRADSPGVQIIRLRFDQPQRIRRIHLRFRESEHERQQEFVLRYSTAADQQGAKPREIVRQQWSFSPGGSTEEIEDYTVQFEDVTAIELEIDPDRGSRRLPATLAELMMA